MTKPSTPPDDEQPNTPEVMAGGDGDDDEYVDLLPLDDPVIEEILIDESNYDTLSSPWVTSSAKPNPPPQAAAKRSDDDSLGFDIDSHTATTGPMPTRIGDYVIDRLIGSGGMGRVYLAKHQTMQRVVAIKTLPPEQMAQATAVERFYEEVRAAARLLHPNIVTAFDAGNSSGFHFLAMEYVDGSTLTDIVSNNGPMTVVEAVAVIRGAARGLAYAHSAGIVHRDVKPSNLMRAGDGTVKVVDLGLASIATQQSFANVPKGANKPGRLIGTIAFMSPEQLEQPDHVDGRSDIYSLGATLYFLLTGRPPYEGEFLEQIRAHRHEPLPELFAVRPDVDLPLEHVFRRMMAKRPQERYASFVEVLADLESSVASDAPPAWISTFAVPKIPGDSSTHRSGSTDGEQAKVMGIDVGMFYATCAMADPSGKVELLVPADTERTQQRLAMADGPPIFFGEAAAARRESFPGSVLHCIPLYIGQSKVDHLVHGRKCPAEVLLAMQIRQLVDTCWNQRSSASAVAITVPTSYDQFHRQAVIQAAKIAGIRSVRLVDRSLAVLQAWRHDQAMLEPSLRKPVAATASREPPQVVVSVTGLATEISVCRYRGSRLQQLATTGQWHYGTLQWQQRLVDLVVAACVATHGFDPRQSMQTASALQVACERALPKFLLLESVNVTFQRRNRPVAVSVTRRQWLDACEPLMVELLQMIDTALENADVDPKRVSHCLLLGILTRIGANRARITKKFSPETEFVLVERTDAARGAAICVAGELPGRGDIPLPPQAATSHDLALLVVDAHNRRRIRPIIPRGTAIPARTNRRIATGGSSSQVLSVVESSTWRETSWRKLGSHSFEMLAETDALELTFEVDVDARLVIRRRDPNSGGFLKLQPLPTPTLAPDELEQWTQWIKELMPVPPKRTVAPEE